MVRFLKNALVIEIPCRDSDPVEYYEGLQNALYEVFWSATSNGGSELANGANWIATYLGPALAQLEPAAHDVLKQMALTKPSERPIETDSLTDEALLKLIRGLKASQFEALLGHLKSL